ncbi:MAG: diguanylate cyclase [Polyangiaceae bacterium]
MDPLVRAAFGLQQVSSRFSGTLLAIGASAYLVFWAGQRENPWHAIVAALVLVVSLGFRVARRLGRLSPRAIAWLDFELFSHLIVVGYAGVLLSPGGLEGPFYPVLYALVMLAAAFARPAAAAATLAFAVLTEAALAAIGYRRPVESIWPHALLMGVFAFLNMAVFRAEIARVRALSKQRIAAEIERMKQAARSYRLLGAPSSAVDRNSIHPPDDESRLLHSGVDEIHQATSYALDVLRHSLQLRTAALLWLDSTGSKLAIQEISSADDSIAPGPFSSKDGIAAAAIARGQTVSLHGDKAGQAVPYYGVLPEVGAVCAAPLMDAGHIRGVLLVDRPVKDPFTSVEEELLTAATHFMLRAIENERVFVQLERAKIEQGKLYRAVDTLAGATTERGVIEACVSSAREFAAFDYAIVTLFDRAKGEHEICAVSGDAEELLGERFKHNAGLVSMVVANRHPLPYRGEYDAARQVVFTRRLRPPDMPSLLVLPLIVHDRALGTLVLGSRRRAAFGDSVRPTLEVLASHVAVSLANARMVKRLEEMATTDGMTGLLNKRALVEMAQQKVKSALRFKKPLSVLVCDIDHFKKVNDTYGHDVGDVVIKGFGEVLKRTKRDTDVVGRFGGEEFIVVCEQTDAEGAVLLAERVRTELETTTFHTEAGPLCVTCSLGVATLPHAGESWEGLFKATDEALYASKRGGRNRVTLWSPRLQGCAA